MKKNIKRVARAIVKEKDEASPSITSKVLEMDNGPPKLAIPFTKKMKK